jgi:hypothetical protein
MFKRNNLLVLVFLVLPLTASAQSSSSFNSDPTSLFNKSPGFNVKVTFESRMVKTVEIFPDIEPGQLPASMRVIRSLKISVNETEIFVPRSAYVDLYWLDRAELTTVNSIGTLRIIGGDASESYFVNIEFDANAVRSRSFYSGMIPDEPTQITRYFQRTID